MMKTILMVLACILGGGCASWFVQTNKKLVVNARTRPGRVDVICFGKADPVFIKPQRDGKHLEYSCRPREIIVRDSGGPMKIVDSVLSSKIEDGFGKTQVWVIYDDYIILCPWVADWTELAGTKSCSFNENTGWVFPVIDYGHCVR
ncbi:MAG: hypothetical protein H6686_11775 [Fibrobacteria bacterium]|nr:hypothetical protein [Fibrobacteria bacterium]